MLTHCGQWKAHTALAVPRLLAERREMRVRGSGEGKMAGGVSRVALIHRQEVEERKVNGYWVLESPLDSHMVLRGCAYLQGYGGRRASTAAQGWPKAMERGVRRLLSMGTVFHIPPGHCSTR